MPLICIGHYSIGLGGLRVEGQAEEAGNHRDPVPTRRPQHTPKDARYAREHTMGDYTMIYHGDYAMIYYG
jgi:hypothetical protein